MARTIEDIIRTYIGDQVLSLARLQADNEQLREELAALKAERDAKAPPKPNGRAVPDAPLPRA